MAKKARVKICFISYQMKKPLTIYAKIIILHYPSTFVIISTTPSIWTTQEPKIADSRRIAKEGLHIQNIDDNAQPNKNNSGKALSPIISTFCLPHISLQKPNDFIYHCTVVLMKVTSALSRILIPDMHNIIFTITTG